MFVVCVHWWRQDVKTSSPDLNLRTRTYLQHSKYRASKQQDICGCRRGLGEDTSLPGCDTMSLRAKLATFRTIQCLRCQGSSSCLIVQIRQHNLTQRHGVTSRNTLSLPASTSQPTQNQLTCDHYCRSALSRTLSAHPGSLSLQAQRLSLLPSSGTLS